ncbi:hypothetical protein [Aquimarina intermedia]|uniref:Uncharacterized protein n=1 Tax=Aquimarina intermedia TaxID=350814 RepID=A0A5S5C009_9FLAO|nr:hypothetical protein [Aquimarina intermedia]TYP71660.1 hypothetical protein BD809_10870 [Aquimarina intermedia]
MKAVTVKTLKIELNERSHHELVELCLRLSKFKKENKELLTYLLLEAQNEAGFIESVKEEITDQFSEINTKTFYFIKKSVRKILRMVKKYIRYSKNKETEVELLLFFCEQLSEFSPSIKRNNTLLNLYRRELASIEKKIQALHEDLQYDYKQELDELTNF